MLCPQCGSTMQEEHHGVTLDHCLSCGGIWFDADELRPALRRPSSSRLAEPVQFETVEDDTVLDCPRCQTTSLAVQKVAGAQVQSCARCRGVFVGSRAFLTIRDRKSYGAADAALDAAIVAPDLAATAVEISAGSLEGVLEVLADVFTAW